YFAAGAAEVLLIVGASFGGSEPIGNSAGTVSEANLHSTRLRSILLVLAVFAVLGSLPWIATGLARPRFDGATANALIDRLASSSATRAAGITAEEIANAQASKGFVIEIGRVLYPRFFTRGDGLASAHPWPAYAPREFPRLGFLLLHQARQDVIVSTRDVPTKVAQGADAIVLGCQREGYIEARLVLMTEAQVLIQGAPISDPCP
ncbi:MAG TPA: hypothetical protein VFH29_01290, partial [Anaerolineales bacterium]|nr:hypothetical protein [Anaerolineales bacterium]